MMDRPEPFRDLAWDAQRGREFTDRAVDLWQEFLTSLPGLPVGRLLPSEKVRDAVAIPVPDAPSVYSWVRLGTRVDTYR